LKEGYFSIPAVRRAAFLRVPEVGLLFFVLLAAPPLYFVEDPKSPLEGDLIRGTPTSCRPLEDIMKLG
jgi:hypothetical protein